MDKSKPQAEAAAEVAQAEAAAEVEVPAAEVEQSEAEQAPEVEGEAEVEAAIEEPAIDEIAELNKSLIPMQHRDGNGACDSYEQDKDGNILVPASEAALMLEHGFVLAVSE